ncbi:hypothetical protein SHKM778_28410 [Streptomyces sp. KM77-8]|uniref:Uncharacterized protein n=1 Tax=Streptomyces haneummycinicus TaxID=3074435 RepID=A0AAT9HGK1_9ACTN
MSGPVGVLADQPETAVRRAEVGRDPHRPVGGAVVDEHDLEVTERLARYRFQAFSEIYLDILKGHDNTEARLNHQLVLLPRHFAHRDAERPA